MILTFSLFNQTLATDPFPFSCPLQAHSSLTWSIPPQNQFFFVATLTFFVFSRNMPKKLPFSANISMAESRLCNFWIYALPIQVAHGTVCVQLCTSREVVLVWHNLYSTWYKQIRSRSVVAKFVFILVHAKRWQQCGGTICARFVTCREVAQFVRDG